MGFSLVGKFRCLLLLDLDENLISVEIDKGERSKLSASAQAFLSGIELDEAELRPSAPAYKIKAICRQDWIDLFNEVISVNKLYKELNPEDRNKLITIGFLTSSSYEYAEFYKVFGQLYTESIRNQVMPPKDTDAFFFNIDELYAVCGPAALTLAAKGEFMDKCFPVWTDDLGELKRENIILVDDALANCENAQEYGFTAIHNPTNILGRAPGTLYRSHKDLVFAELHKIVNRAKMYCQTLLSCRQALSCHLL